MPAVFRCFFLAMQPSLAMVICDLWDSPTIKRKSERWMVHVPIMVSHIQESTDYFGGWGLPHYAMSFFFEGLWMFIFTKDPWWNRIETTGSWAPGQWMPTLRLGASGGDEIPPVYFWGLSPGLPSHDHKWRPSHGDITSWMTFFQ